MERFARRRRVLFVEEPIPTAHHLPYLEFHAFAGTARHRGPAARSPTAPDPRRRERLLAGLLDQMTALLAVRAPVLWFYTPMLWPAAAHLADGAAAVVYDCMDELSAFDFAPPGLRANEAALIRAADLVLTGGHAIYEAKRPLHDNIHAFPSSVDQAHFRQRARPPSTRPPDQERIPGPRLGYAGVIDERIDLGLLAACAAARPDWSFVMVGPVVKVDPARLPRAPNIHWLGQRAYAELPAYMAGWDVALMPFALNEATRFISPTKTPEYLAAGCPVVSTPVRDVVRSYGGVAGRAHRRGRGRPSSPPATPRSPRARTRLARRGRRPPRRPVLGRDPRRDGGAGRRGGRAQGRRLRRRRRRPRPCAGRVRPPYDVVVAGAGFAGSVIAERMAEASGKRVLVCDTRDHVGGNAYDAPDAAGILVHRYGPHIFHTNSEEVVDYLSRFTAWRPYEHRVLADLGDRRLPMPINRTTLAAVFGRAAPRRRGGRAAARRARRAGGEDRDRPRRRGRDRRPPALPRPSSRATPASSGASTRPSSTTASRRGCRRASPTTTATSSTASRRCRATATRGCSSGCSTIRASTSRSAPTSTTSTSRRR